MTGRSAKEMRAREAEILGKPPRIAPLDRASVAAEVSAFSVKVRGGVVGDAKPLPPEAIPEIFFTLHRFPDLWEAITALSLRMQSGTSALSARDRELALLRTAWLVECPYEWGEHVRHAKKIGMTSEEIERIAQGSAAGWEAHDRAILAAAEELRANAFVSDATWETLARRLDDRQLFELIVLIGHFTTIAYFQNSLRLRLEPSNQGLAAR